MANTRKGKKRWIQGLDIEEGAFSAKARRAGKTTAEYAEEKDHAPGKLGKEARLAKTLIKAGKNKKKGSGKKK